MRVVIVEPIHGGHTFTYVRRLVSSIRGLVDEIVLVVSREAEESQAFREQIVPLGDAVRTEATIPTPSGGMFAHVRQKVGNITWAAREYKADAVYVPMADAALQATGLLALTGWSPFRRGVHSEGVLVRASFGYRDLPRRRVPPWLGTIALRSAPWSVIQVVDHISYEWAHQSGGPLASRIGLLPDAYEAAEVLTKDAARVRLGLPREGRYLGCAGWIDERKGVDRLIRAFASAPLNPDDRLLLVGAAAEPIRAVLRGPAAPLVASGRIIAIDRYVSEPEFEAAIASMDLVCTPYPAHPGPASVALWALAMDRPVLGSNTLWLGHMVPRFGLGWTCDVLRDDSLSHALRERLDAAPSHRRTPAAERLLKFHSRANVDAGWRAGLRRRLGLPEEAGRIRWEWVAAAAGGGGHERAGRT